MPYSPRKRKPRPPREPGYKRIASPGLHLIAERALNVTHEDIREYLPREIDLQVVQAMLGGAINYSEIGEMVHRSPQTVSKALRDPIACAWISNKVHQLVHTRIGLVDAAMLRAALSGNVRAAEVIYKRFGKLVSHSIVVHGTLGDLSKYTDADLEAQISSELKRHPDLTPSPSQSSTIDVTPDEEPS